MANWVEVERRKSCGDRIALVQVQVNVLLSSLIAVNLFVPKQSGRRGSLRQVTAASSYREALRNTVLNTVNVEMQLQEAMMEVYHSILYTQSYSQCFLVQ